MQRYASQPIAQSPSTIKHLSKVPRNLRHRRSRNRIASERPKHIEQNTRIRRLVQARAHRSAAQLAGSASTNNNVNALWVGLRTVGLARSMQSQDLVPEHVVARREVGNRQVPAEVVLDQVVGGPGTGVATGFPC
jgi:hypothetical protein